MTESAEPNAGLKAYFNQLGGGASGSGTSGSGDDFVVAAGTANAVTAPFAAAPTLTDGTQFKVRALYANTGAATFNPAALGALPLTKLGGTPIKARNIAGPGHELLIRYNSAAGRYELLNPAHHFTRTFEWESSIPINVTLADALIMAMPVGGVLVGITVHTQGGNGSCSFDIKKSTYAASPPTVSIFTSGLPTISGATKYTDTTLTGVTTTVDDNDVLLGSLVSSSTFRRIVVTLEFAIKG